MASQRPAYQNMVEHLRPAVMEHTESPILGQASIDSNQRPLNELRVSSVLLGCLQNPDWCFVVFGVEIATDGDEAVRIGIENFVECQANFECLAASFQSRNEKSFCPPGR